MSKNSNTAKRSDKPDVNDSMTAPPQLVRDFHWILKNWRKHWLSLLVLFFFCLLLPGVTDIFLKKVVDEFRKHYASVTLKVIHFDHQTGAITAAFDNETRSSVLIDIAYVTVAPTNAVPMKPLPEAWQRTITVFDKGVLRVPSGAGLEFGPLCTTDRQTDGRPFRLGYLLVRPSQSFLLADGPTVTNLIPCADSLNQICQQFAEGARLKVTLHTSVIDGEGQSRNQEIQLGNYFLADDHVGMQDTPNPRPIDIMKHARVGGKSSDYLVFTGNGEHALPPIPEKCKWAFLENQGQSELLIIVRREEIEGLVPVVLLRRYIGYGCNFSVDLVGNEALPADLGTWVLTCDDGKTILNLPMAFAESWSNALARGVVSGEQRIALPLGDWKVLVGGERWAHIRDGAVIYKVIEQGWQKLIPAGDATLPSLMSNFTSVAFQHVTNDPSWLPMSDPNIAPSNSKSFLLIKNEVVPELSGFSNLYVGVVTNTNAAQAPDEASTQNSVKGKK